MLLSLMLLWCGCWCCCNSSIWSAGFGPVIAITGSNQDWMIIQKTNLFNEIFLTKLKNRSKLDCCWEGIRTVTRAILAQSWCVRGDPQHRSAHVLYILSFIDIFTAHTEHASIRIYLQQSLTKSSPADGLRSRRYQQCPSLPNENFQKWLSTSHTLSVSEKNGAK